MNPDPNPSPSPNRNNPNNLLDTINLIRYRSGGYGSGGKIDWEQCFHKKCFHNNVSTTMFPSFPVAISMFLIEFPVLISFSRT